uniref:Uncharacterized protein n=1 Tax=Coccolithus braarudii TaxID=221442 RepID=A0A7S0LKN8_9EUKA
MPDEDDDKEAQKKHELEIAAAAAHKQALFDAWKFQNAMRFREMQIRHRHHHRHHRRSHKGAAKEMRFREKSKSKRHGHHHHHKHHMHRFNPYQQYYGSFFQQYYAHPRFNRADDEDEDDEDEEDEKKEKKAEEAKKMRFEEVKAKQKAHVESEQEMWHKLEYGNSFAGSAESASQPAAAAQQAGSAYGPPMSSGPPPTNAPKLNMGYFSKHPSFLTPPHHAAASPSMRFQQTNMQAQAHAQAHAQMGMGMRMGMRAGAPQDGNPNPGGVPMPFYPPSQAPPLAPNQVPAPSAIARGVFPQNMQISSSASMPPAGAGVTPQPGVNPGAAPMNPNAPNGQVNGYPFNSFLQVDESELIHPTVHKMAYNPFRHQVRTPLTQEHLEPFPLL